MSPCGVFMFALGFIWLRMGSSDALLWPWLWTVWFHYTCRVSWAEWLAVSREVFIMKLVTTAVRYDTGRVLSLDVLVDDFPQGVTAMCCKVLTYGIIVYLACTLRNSDLFLKC